ncbi:MAG: monophosphatase [Pseudomonadota bacterium]|nr:monophosphatase [Pseudomonadota bacterium]
MSQAALHPMLNIAIKAARAAGAIINRASLDVERLTVTSKGPNDFVTEVDQAAEQAIIDTIRQAYPGHGFLAEESGRSQGAQHSDFVWIIDPLDGTTNFIHGFPQYAVSIALAFKGKVEQAVVYDPSRNDLFYATKGRGAYLNDKRLRVSKRLRLADALIGTGFPFRKGDNFKRYLKIMEELMPACAGLRRPGAAALDLCYVAAGWYDGFFETGLNPWDIAAGSLIVTEAGGLIGNFTGEADYLYQREVIAATPKVYGQLVQILTPFTRIIKDDEPETPVVEAAPKARKPRAKKAEAEGGDVAPAAPARTVRKAAPTQPGKLVPLDEYLAATQPELDAEPQKAELPIDVPLSPAAALAAAFEPMPEEAAPAPVVIRKAPTRIRKEDMPPKEEAPEAPRRSRRRDGDAPF